MVLVEMCKFLNQVLNTMKPDVSIEIWNDVRNEVITPTFDLVAYEAAHREIDGEVVDLLLDNIPKYGEADVFAEKITPELALDYVLGQRAYVAVSEHMEKVQNNRHPAEDDGSMMTKINIMKSKLDVASALLDISVRTHVDVLKPILDKMSAIIRKIYENVVSTPSVANEPVVEEPEEEEVVATPTVDEADDATKTEEVDDAEEAEDDVEDVDEADETDDANEVEESDEAEVSEETEDELDKLELAEEAVEEPKAVEEFADENNEDGDSVEEANDPEPAVDSEPQFVNLD